MILSAQTILRRQSERWMIRPFSASQEQSENGLSWGLGPCGYDVRLKMGLVLEPGGFVLGSTIEEFFVPDDVLMRIVDKSTWARRGLFVQNTVAEPGWTGFLTLELTNNSRRDVVVPAGSPIAQIIFERLDEPTSRPYVGKYQSQADGPQPAIMVITRG